MGFPDLQREGIAYISSSTTFKYGQDDQKSWANINFFAPKKQMFATLSGYSFMVKKVAQIDMDAQEVRLVLEGINGIHPMPLEQFCKENNIRSFRLDDEYTEKVIDRTFRTTNNIRWSLGATLSSTFSLGEKSANLVKADIPKAKLMTEVHS